MKRMLIALAMMFTIVMSASAMGYEQARREALFLTDKMAYELNLTSEQYDAAYEINLDYLMGVTSVDDVYSTYWTRRNLDLSYILLDWQWEAFRAATYFYRPLYWDAGYWHFGVYARYPRRAFFYFDRPSCYVNYRGGHGWHANGGRSFYYDRRDNFRQPQNNNNMGMRDRYDRGDFSGARSTTTGRNSSTRVTVNRGDINGNSQGSFGGARTSTRTSTNRVGSTTKSTGTFGGSRSTATTTNTTTGNRTGSFGSRSTGTNTTTSRPSFTPRSSSSSTTGTSTGSSRSTGTFGGNRSTGSFGTSSSTSTSTNRVSSPSSRSTGTFGSSRSTGSFGSSRSNSSFGSSRSSAPASRSTGGSSSSSSRGSFGGRR